MLAVFYMVETCTLKIEPRCVLHFLLFEKSKKVLMTDRLFKFATLPINFSTNVQLNSNGIQMLYYRIYATLRSQSM